MPRILGELMKQPKRIVPTVLHGPIELCNELAGENVTIVLCGPMGAEQRICTERLAWAHGLSGKNIPTMLCGPMELSSNNLPTLLYGLMRLPRKK